MAFWIRDKDWNLIAGEFATAAGVQVSHSQPKMVSGVVFEDQYRFDILS